MATFFAIFILIPILAFLLVAVVMGCAIILALAYGVIMCVIGWIQS